MTITAHGILVNFDPKVPAKGVTIAQKIRANNVISCETNHFFWTSFHLQEGLGPNRLDPFLISKFNFGVTV